MLQEVYDEIVWENKPSTKTKLNARNLNAMSHAIEELDLRSVAIDDRVDILSGDVAELNTRMVVLESTLENAKY